MKTLFRTSALVIALLFSVNALATTGTAKVVVKEGKTFDLFVMDAPLSFSVSLKTAEGVTLYTQAVNDQASYSTRFDMNYLENGSYILHIEDANRVQEFPISLNGNTVNVAAVQSFDLYKPTVQVKDELVYVNALSAERVARLRVNIYDATGKSVMTDTIVGTNNIGRVYSIENLPEGEYALVIDADGRTFENTIVK